MSELYGDVRELFEQGLNDVEIATVTGLPVTMVRDCLELFEEDFDYFPDGVSSPDYVVTGCEPAEYSEEF